MPMTTSIASTQITTTKTMIFSAVGIQGLSAISDTIDEHCWTPGDSGTTELFNTSVRDTSGPFFR
jgi:hypothetical protein